MLGYGSPLDVDGAAASVGAGPSHVRAVLRLLAVVPFVSDRAATVEATAFGLAFPMHARRGITGDLVWISRREEEGLTVVRLQFGPV